MDSLEPVASPPKATRLLLSSFCKSVLDTGRFAEITISAIVQLARAVPLVEAVGALHSDSDEKLAAEAHLKRFKDDVAFLEGSKELRHAAVYAQSIVTIWGTLEAHLEDVLVTALSNDKRFLASDTIQKVKIPIALLETTTSTERLELLVDTIQRELNSKFKRGIGQFESVFEAFGLPGTIDSETKRTFIEFSAVRNLIAHRRSVADKRFVESCPWLGLSVGAPFMATSAMLWQYIGAACLYASSIQERIEQRYGDVSNELINIFSKLRVFISAQCTPRPKDVG